MLRDIKSDIAADLGFYTFCDSNTTFPGQIVDTAHYESGLMFSFAADLVDGTYTPKIEESDDSGMAGATDVPADRLIGTIANVTITASASTGDPLPTIGVTTSKRYVRISIVATGVSNGAVVAVITNKIPELKPVT